MFGGRGKKFNDGWEYRKVRKMFIDCLFVKLENRLFGWELAGTSEELEGVDVQYSYDQTRNEVSRIVTPLHDKKLNFMRPYGYAKSFLFRLTELLYKIISPLRRLVLLLTVMIVPLFALSFILSITDCEFGSFLPFSLLKQTLPYIGIAYAAVFVIPLLLALLGFALRKLFRLDARA
ncbi:MAG: hypothetical protein HFJ81_06170 [Clostridia bacterium]|nr:hypothetical protein [Clostridia bacterium]